MDVIRNKELLGRQSWRLKNGRTPIKNMTRPTGMRAETLPWMTKTTGP
jgi:hypothetical protein